MATGPDDESRVYVGNLLPRAKETHLQAQFARFGVIHNIWVARKPPGFAFVQFAKRGDALRAVDECNGSGGVEILGKPVRVQMAGEKKSARADAGPASDPAPPSAGGQADAATAGPERGESPRHGRSPSADGLHRGGDHDRKAGQGQRRSRSSSWSTRRSRSRSASPSRRRRSRQDLDRGHSVSLSMSRSRSRRRRGSSDDASRRRSPYRSPSRRSRSRSRDRRRQS